MHSKILKRCGIVLIVVGAVDIAYMIWCVSHGQSYSSSFNIFAVIGGVLLCRGGLKTARWIAMLSSFMFVACAGTIVAMPFLFPMEFWFAAFRNGAGVISATLLAAGMLVLLFWLRRELQRPEVAQAQAEAGLPPPKLVQPIVAGIVLPVVLVTILTLTLRGDTAHEALRRAEQQLGGSYHYVVTSIQMQSNATEKRVSAVVAAYSDSEFKTIRIDWKE